jgi:hypothetical protein
VVKRPHSHAAALAVLVLTAPFGWFACNIIFGIDSPELAPPKPDTGTPKEDAGCVLAHWPEAPRTEDDADGGGNVRFIVALKEIGLSTKPPNPVSGYDLDGQCTCFPGPRTCVPRVADAGDHCDEPGGRDISMNRNVFEVVAQSPAFSAETLNANLTKGRYGMLAEISEYNGGKNDKSVRVQIFLSSGTSGDAGPQWDGGDPWDLDPKTLASDAGPTSIYVDTTAYVSDGVLVASKLAGVKITLGVGSESVDLELAQAVFTARVEKRTSGFALADGTIVGRWPTKNVLKAIAPLQAPGLGQPLCAPISKGIYDYAKGVICRSADISSNPARDEDRGADCDALSFAMRFLAEPARFGVVRAKEYGDAGCRDWNDECTKP